MYRVREKEHKSDVKTLEEKKYIRARTRDSLTEVHSLTITDHVAKENHITDWEGLTFPARDTDWTARGAEEAVEIRKTRAHFTNRDGVCHQLPSLSSNFLVKKTSIFITNGAVYQH